MSNQPRRSRLSGLSDDMESGGARSRLVAEIQQLESMPVRPYN
jgi:hypothetical protein